MEKKLIVPIAVLTFFALGSVVFAQDSVPPRVISGTITNIDSQHHQFVVQNKFGTIFLNWNEKTQFNPAGFQQRLKEGTPVFVYFNETAKDNLMASRVELNWTGFGLKGVQYPFDCGPSVC